MGKAIIILAVLAAIAGAGYFLFRNFYPNFAVFTPAFRPPRKDIKQYLPQDGELNYPLTIPQGFRLGLFADLKGGLPRVLTFDPEGVLVASLTKNGKVVALPDDDRDGVADEVIDILTGLNRPHGMVFYQGKLYVAETDKVVRYSYDPRSFSASGKEVLFELPSGGRHFTRTIKIKDGKLYTSVGSSCDTCVESDWRRASILVSDLDGGGLEVYARGLRNTVFFTFDDKGRMWGNDMGRDFLGDDLPPDELNVIEEGKDYGWPYCYGKKTRDAEFRAGEKGTYCLDTEAPAFNYPAHVSPLGLAFIDSNLFPASDQDSLLVSLHGSWNRSVPVGYKIVKLTVFAGGVTRSKDFIDGWLADGEVLGRPADLVFDKDGILYISDDKAGLIYNLSRGF